MYTKKKQCIIFCNSYKKKIKNNKTRTSIVCMYYKFGHNNLYPKRVKLKQLTTKLTRFNPKLTFCNGIYSTS